MNTDRSGYLCLDIDNVIASSDFVMREVIREFTNGRVNLKYSDIQEFNYHECPDGDGNCLARSEWSGVHDLFSESTNLWKIEPINGAVETIRELATAGMR